MKHMKIYEQIHDPFGEEVEDGNIDRIPDEPGICKNCGSVNIDYGNLIPIAAQVAWEYDCEDCNFCGLEVYNIEFYGHEER